MDIGKYISEGWNITIKNIITLIVALLIAFVLGTITIGILWFPLFTGFQMMFVKVKRGQVISTNDVFTYLNKTWPLLLASICIGILVCIGLVLLVVPGLIFATWWMYALLYIADKNMGIREAMNASKETVTKNGLGIHFLFLIIASIITNIGQVAFYIGILFTMPIGMGAIACAFEEESK